MVPSGALRLRDFLAGDDAWLIGCVGSPEELERFAGPSLTWPLTEAQLQGIRDDPAVTAWTAEVGGEPVGHVEVVRMEDGSGRVARVLIDPRRRGEGLARKLVAAAIERAPSRLALSVFADNQPAIRTYLALGFEDIGEDPLDPPLRAFVRGVDSDAARSS